MSDPQQLDETAQYVGTAPSAICSLLARPLLITGYLRDLLTRHFASPNYLEEPDLRHLLWQPNERASILIETNHRWNPKTTGRRPAVILKRNEFQNRRIAIGDKAQPTLADRGVMHFATLWLGSHTLFCLGASGAQAELLATEVQRELTEFSQQILAEMALHRFQVTQVGAVAEVEESSEHFCVPITAGYAYQEAWQVRRQTPTLKRVTLSTLLDL